MAGASSRTAAEQSVVGHFPSLALPGLADSVALVHLRIGAHLQDRLQVITSFLTGEV